MDETNQPEKSPETIQNARESVDTEPEPVSAKRSRIDGSRVDVASSKSKPRRLLLTVVIVLAVLGAGMVAWQISRVPSEKNIEDNTNPVAARASRLSIKVALAEGGATYRPVDGNWQELTKDSQLGVGDVVRTDADGKVELALADGSAIRLDTATMIEIDSLDEDDVRADHLTGRAYWRFAPSKRQHAVAVDETTYQASDAVFATVNQPDSSGIQVFQSSVQLSDSKQTVAEGKQYYQKHNDDAVKNKTTAIDIGQLVDSEFVRWNLARDERDVQFKDKLGVLKEVKQLAEQRAKAEAELRQAAAAAAEAKRKAQLQAAAEKSNQRPKPKRYQKDRVERGDMKLWRRGSHLGWGYTGQAIHGFKIVYSYQDRTPELGEPNVESVYVSNQYASSYKHFRKKLDLKPFRKYYLAVCAYTDGSESEACVDYSDVLIVRR